LAFFINSKGKIHHVGIVLSDNKIIHAHGWLRIDELDEKGILGRSNEKYSHNLALIKRHV
jgi:cell wall-associated NlpC family hydrolase